jgi:integrase
LHLLVPGALEIFAAWCEELERDHGFGPDYPLFPATEMGLNAEGVFTPIGIARKGWASTQPVRDVFKRAFATAGLPYKNPHLTRDMLVHRYMTMELTPAQFKAVSQSLGHSDVLTTFTSYGHLPTHRQSELIRSIAVGGTEGKSVPMAELEAFVARLRAGR